jgi:hypothetical protein
MHRIERGAKLVIAIHSDTNCILQMPRVNKIINIFSFINNLLQETWCFFLGQFGIDSSKNLANCQFEAYNRRVIEIIFKIYSYVYLHFNGHFFISKSLQYLNAVQTMRKYRVNMNILYDHSPEVKISTFKSHLIKFC